MREDERGGEKASFLLCKLFFQDHMEAVALTNVGKEQARTKKRKSRCESECCVRERERECVCVRERLCVCEREREKWVNVRQGDSCVCV